MTDSTERLRAAIADRYRVELFHVTVTPAGVVHVTADNFSAVCR